MVKASVAGYAMAFGNKSVKNMRPLMLPPTLERAFLFPNEKGMSPCVYQETKYINGCLVSQLRRFI